MLLLIDNYDSFAYNLYQLAGAFSPDVMVERNDALTADEVAALAPEAIFLSPGPGRPEDAGVCPALVRRFAGKIPIFGVCLGMQVICSALGGRVSYARTLMHGKVSKISLEGESVETPLADGRLTLAYDGETLTVYRNGWIDQRVEGLRLDGDEVKIGGYKGTLERATAYSRCLSQDEVKQMFWQQVLRILKKE